MAVVLSGCFPTRVATPYAKPSVELPTYYEAQPSVVEVRDTKAFNRALQVAIGMGLQVRSVDAQAGLFIVEVTQFDQVATIEATDGQQHYRRLSLTAVVGKTEATVSPVAVECAGARCGGQRPELVESEADIFRKILQALSPPAESPAPKAKTSEI